MGCRLSRALLGVLPGARQPVLGGYLGSSCLPASARCIPAQRLVPPDWHRRWCNCSGCAQRLLPAEPCWISVRARALGSSLRAGGNAAAQLRFLRSQLSRFTTAIIVGDELGAVGGPSGDAFQLAVARSVEICIGIVCAGVVLATTDLGNTRRRLATLLAELSAQIAGGLVRAVRLPPLQAASQTERRRLALRIAGLGTVIDQAAGEISNLPLRPRALQVAADSLFDAIAAWRLVATHLELVPPQPHGRLRSGNFCRST